jgi:hypothetical protein
MSLVGLKQPYQLHPLAPPVSSSSIPSSLPSYLKFPFKPYDCQLSLISKIHEAMSGRVDRDRDGKEVNGEWGERGKNIADFRRI